MSFIEHIKKVVNHYFHPAPESPSNNFRSDTIRRLSDSDLRKGNLKRLFGDVSYDQWHWILTAGREEIPELSDYLPSLPSEKTQKGFTGLHGTGTFGQAVKTYAVMRESANKYNVDLGHNCKIVDFGCGWGRFIHVFFRDFDADQIIGMDVQQRAVELCQEAGLPCPIIKIDPWPPTTLAEESVSIVFAFSVFSHLSEENHWAWLKEFYRILRPGGMAFITTRDREFINHVARLRSKGNIQEHAIGAAETLIDTKFWLAKYDAGEYVFDRMSRQYAMKEWFGQACIPEAYVKRNWSKIFSTTEFIPCGQHRASDQNIIVAMKANAG